MANLGLVTSILWVDFQLESHVHMDSITHYVSKLFVFVQSIYPRMSLEGRTPCCSGELDMPNVLWQMLQQSVK